MDTLSRRDLESIFSRIKNWGRWGPDDQAGALNYISSDLVAAAAQSVREGVSISLGADFPVDLAPDNLYPAHHMMVLAGDARGDHGVPGLETTMDYVGVNYHGMACSHIDALCHVFVEGRMYNDRPASDVRSSGARTNDVMVAANGVHGRGVLLDLPALHGADWLEPDTVVTPEELLACEAEQGISLSEGDIVLINTGRYQRRAELGPWDTQNPGLAGLSALCAPLLHERRIAVLGADGVNDPLPSAGIDGWAMPLHMCCLVGMGVHLLHNLDLRALTAHCRERRRYTFLFTCSPLRIVGGTGSPLNPVAIF